MKKTAYIILAAALLAAACKPEKPVTSPTLEKMTLTVRFDAPQSRISFAGEADGKTKTAWSAEDKLWVRSDTQPAWERGDCFTMPTTMPSVSTCPRPVPWCPAMRRR